jgi:hypothetical protein
LETKVSLIEQLFKSLDEFTREAYTQFIVIEGHEPDKLLIAIDHLTELADIQFSHHDKVDTGKRAILGKAEIFFKKFLQ